MIALTSPPKGDLVRLGPICCLPALLRELGVEPGPLFARFGLAETVFLDADFQISVAARASLLATSAREADCPHLGLMIGQRNQVGVLGPIGHLMRNAPDVRSALADLVAYFHLHTPSALISVQVGERVSSLAYEPAHTALEGMDHVHDAAMALAWNILRALCGPTWLPREVHLRRRQPTNLEPYRRFFQAPFCFNAEQSAIVFSSSWLNKKIQQADPLLHEMVVGHALILQSRTETDIVQRARHALVRRLGSDPCALQDLARELSLHPRTLNRRLREAGTTFRQLHQEARHQRACQLLRDTDASISTIAAMLCYSGANAFTRAFLQWEGQPPASWRKRKPDFEIPDPMTTNSRGDR